jgi:hypothetical protein
VECGDGGRVVCGGSIGYEVDRKIKTRFDGRSLRSSIKTGKWIVHLHAVGVNKKGV